ncbi:Zn2/Cys6 DNA-binding protein [Glarea lozoyensis ATCC 20868]|uniref:Zn2/Cys6 DNA-binding protein n=1 Tax=Glarea lozoyensis (strain ATCC 20868 / MF5171) TaxID=1116229 RepID=S3DAD6_GLAL2|nr:Zn2/Cys6 DNA-binding protein [Glarea lozoyensis ATCC 20868]EPE34685.1 Zn2/Cys6 DNA-binding protein [Glarea lozoyensis ATCC 20868]
MVATRPPFYADEEEPSFRRYNSRGQGYSLSHDREMPSAPYSGRDLLSNHDSRGGNHAPESDNNSRPRSRIPVACGRCRKRKIRCSGDLGTGLPCTNCKGAGNEQCQFLRVQSDVVSMKHENADFSHFEHNPARVHCRTTTFGPHSYIPPGGPVPEAYYPRSSSMSSYVVPQSRYYTLGSFSEYPEENVNVDYGVQNPSYSLLGNEQFIPPTYPSSSRGWTPAPQAAKATPMYLEQDPGYGGQVSYNSAYQLRPTISPEPKSAVHATSIPIAVTGNSLPPLPPSGTDRVLPYPAGRTALPTQVGSYIRSVTVAPAGYHSYGGTLSSSKSTVHSAIPGTASLAADPYPYSSSSPESLASSAQTVYSTQQLSQQQADLYASSSESLYHVNETSESAYGTSSEKRESHNQDSLSPEETIASLSDRRQYVPFNAGATYPPSSVGIYSHATTNIATARTLGVSQP